MADGEGAGRPSFDQFRLRQNEGKPVVFVPQDAAAAVGSENTPQTAQEKAKRRRDQIRKAQTQHRERKEGYQKELEVDVAQIQDAAGQAERERERLRRENAEIRAMLGKLENFPALPSATEIQAPVHERLFWYQMGDLDKYWKLGQGGTASLGQDNGLSVEKTVTMTVDETMQYPCYQVLPSSPSSTEGYSSEASLDEEDFAINFILALEHICWDHFPLHDPDTPSDEPGHVLMASTMCASNAPDATFISLGDEQSMLKAPIQTWQASGLTLQSIYLLASSLALDDTEITPVQGWFEMMERYGPDLLLNRELVEALKREFVGVVKCLHFGAIMERDAFESVVERVFGAYGYQPFMP